ncbi:MAG: CRISPR-associated endonuclease Cas1 [Candidatus Diapherotrites archaeon]|nr:CRISPR-associated endonuclease Cas1 [Candidatus Diapherotrites archaeon]
MPTLHLANQGSKLRLRQGRLLIVGSDGEELGSFPARKVRRVVIHGNVGLTTPALTYLLRNSGSIHFLSIKGDYYGQAAPTSLPDPRRIAKQLTLPSHRRLEIAREILTSKTRSQMEYLRRSGRLQLVELAATIKRMSAAKDIDELRGFEGIASRLYFEAVAEGMGSLSFRGRRRRPPPDPVNAALSYGYAILLSLATSALLAAGIHPEIGIIHSTGRRRPALALDLMEEFRVAVVDAPVFRAFKRRWLGWDDVRSEGRAVLLNEQGKKKVIEAVETRLSFSPMGDAGDYRFLIFRQAERLASAIVHEKPYKAYVLRRK